MSETSATPASTAPFEDDVYREMVRSRRHGRPMTILVILPDARAVAATRWPWRRAAPPPVVHQVEALVRRYDQVRVSGGRVTVLCPELEADLAAKLASRLSEHLKMPVGAATFPTDGTNTPALITTATNRARRQALTGIVTSDESSGETPPKTGGGAAGLSIV